MRNILNEKKTVRTFLIVVIIFTFVSYYVGYSAGLKDCTDLLLNSVKRVINGEINVEKLAEYLKRLGFTN